MTVYSLPKRNKTTGNAPLNAQTSLPSAAFAPSEGLFLKWLIGLSLIAVPALLLALYWRVMFSGLTNATALDLAQVGRNLSEGRGFSTFFLRPLAMTQGGNPLRQPDVVNGPLFPFALSLAFGALGAKDSVAGGVSAAFYLLTVPLVYLLGLRVFNRNVGLIAAATFAVNGLMLEYAISGLPITLFTFLMTCLLLTIHQLAVRTQEQGSDDTDALDNNQTAAASALPKGGLILAGGLTAALYLTDPVFIWIAPLVLLSVLVLNPTRRIAAALCFLIPMLLLASPWMIRNGLLTGNPIFGLRGRELWMNTPDAYPGLTAYRMSPADMVPGVGVFKAVVRKLLLGIGEVVQAFPQVSASWMLAFLLPSFLFRFSDPAKGAVRRVMMYCFGGILVGSLLFGIQMAIFASLIPTMLIFAVAYLLHLTNQAKLTRSSMAVLAGLLTIAIVSPVLKTVTMGEAPGVLPNAPSARILGQASAPNDVILTDQPWVVAWYANRPAVWIPAADGKIREFRQQFPTTRWLLLSPEVEGFSPEWRQLYGAFRQWNFVCMQSHAAGKPLPSALQIGGGGHALIDSLSGFTSVEPAKGMSPVTVLAGLPERPQSGKH